MNYSDGSEIKVGDTVKTSDNSHGIVVCSIDTNGFTEKYNEKQWSYLGKGILVDFEKYGVIHYENLDTDLVFVSRKNQN